jgi:hypothetical protein
MIAEAPVSHKVFIMIVTFISFSFCLRSASFLSNVLRSFVSLVRSAIISSHTGALPL